MNGARRRVVAGLATLAWGAGALLVFGFLFFIWLIVSPMISAALQVSRTPLVWAISVTAIAGSVVITARTAATRWGRRAQAATYAAAPIVVAASLFVAVSATLAPPELDGMSRWTTVSPLRIAWPVVGAAFLVQALSWVTFGGRTRIEVAFALTSTSLLVAGIAFVTAPAGLRTCLGPFYDQAVYPLPPDVIVVTDNVQVLGTAEPYWIRVVEVRMPGSNTTELKSTLRDRLARRGWIFDGDGRRASAGSYTVEVRDPLFGAPAPADVVELLFSRYRGDAVTCWA
jgi:hypothetical protein